MQLKLNEITGDLLIDVDADGYGLYHPAVLQRAAAAIAVLIECGATSRNISRARVRVMVQI